MGEISICGFVFKSIYAQPLPSPQKQRWMRVSRIFPEFQNFLWWGRGERTARNLPKGSTVL